ncbi:hypothetical protein HDU87_007401 [Geranomyces variabilis]|uniref:Macro-like domain-containing protein n=1 Tax=Geranomyces variabilis TaxID=109894 RepID=A0AAD5TPB0_9FUNG|nr:hypothetical protein HDU87_007401 [Geranomyces variabilis]
MRSHNSLCIAASALVAVLLALALRTLSRSAYSGIPTALSSFDPPANSGASVMEDACHNPFSSARAPLPGCVKRHNDFNITLANLDEDLVANYSRFFDPYLVSNGGRITVAWDGLMWVPGDFDCIVSPANSFGLMDGGADWAISYHLAGGPEGLVAHVQRAILNKFAGQQPVASSFIIDVEEVVRSYLRTPGNHFRAAGETNVKLPRFLAHTPTMRTPQKLGPSTTVPYDAMWSTLVAIREHNVQAEAAGRPDRAIRNVLLPGFGTSYGHVPPAVGARQLALAYKHFLENPADYIGTRQCGGWDPRCDVGSDRGGKCRIEAEKTYLISWDYVDQLAEEIRSTWACTY